MLFQICRFCRFAGGKRNYRQNGMYTSSTSMVAKDPVLVVKLQLESTFSKAILSNAHSRHITVGLNLKKTAIKENCNAMFTSKAKIKA